MVTMAKIITTTLLLLLLLPLFADANADADADAKPKPKSKSEFKPKEPIIKYKPFPKKKFNIDYLSPLAKAKARYNSKNKKVVAPILSDAERRARGARKKALNVAEMNSPVHVVTEQAFINSALSSTNRSHIDMNEIDRCWRRDPGWADKRQTLAMCSIGFSSKMKHNIGKDMIFYEVTDSSDHPTHPKPGTLRYGVSLNGTVWITFKRDMVIKLQQPLLIGELTTIDGRGAEVHIARGAGFVIRDANNIIIHGLDFKEITPTGPTTILIKGGKFRKIGKENGDAVRILNSNNIWIDHNTFTKGNDGLVDLTQGTNMVTISNNWFRRHDKVMLLGHDDSFSADKQMKVTVVYNRFGPGCLQRLPRLRFGSVHIANNYYLNWIGYAIGGGKKPSILSQGNKFAALPNHRMIDWLEDGPISVISQGDKLLGGAYYHDHVIMEDIINSHRMNYGREGGFNVRSADDVDLLTKNAGSFLRCYVGKLC